MTANIAVKPRSEIADEYKWNAPSVFAEQAAWEAATEELLAMLPEIQSYQGRLAEGPDVLADYLRVLDKGLRLAHRIYFYAAMSTNCDATDKAATAMNDRAGGLIGQTMAAAAFTNPELLAIGRETLEKWMDANEALAVYRQFVDNLFRKQQHVRSAEVEQVLGMVADPFGGVDNIYSMLTSADMKFAPATDSSGNQHEVAQSTFDTLLSQPDREVRRTAYNSYTDAYLAHKNTITSTYLTSVKQDVFNMRVRGYNSSLEASLFENNIPVAVHDNLINTYKRFLPTWHKYWKIRRQALGQDDIQPYDIWAPIAQDLPDVPYQQSVEWISEGMKPLGEEYVAALRQGCLQDRWVDIYPNVGKRQGAFSYGTYDTHPFIMMSYDNTLGAMSTLAHELGHSMHSYLARKTQPRVYSGYTLFVAEVASNFNQAMTRAYLREANPDTAFQIGLIEEAMDNFHRYFFIMPTLARFELEVHQRVERGQGLTADDLIELCADLFAEGYGSEMSYERERIGITWATFSHLYSNFYVYQYATGISAAHAAAAKILGGEAGAAERYLEALKAGSSLYPLDTLKHAGIDMTQPDAVETTFGVLEDMVNRLETLTADR
ncbi:MAG: oligoendopeptidase F [Phototrophicaceae bacterium]